MKKGIIAVHGYRKTFEGEEKERIITAIQPVLDIVSDMVKDDLENVEEANGLVKNF